MIPVAKPSAVAEQAQKNMKSAVAEQAQKNMKSAVAEQAQKKGLATTIAIASCFFGLSSCASTTRIYTLPPGADLVLDDQKVLGKSPVEYKEAVWIWTKHKVTARLEGHETVSIVLKNTGMNGAGSVACACTVGLLLPFMFRSHYDPQYLIELNEIAAPTESKPVAARSINFTP